MKRDWPVENRLVSFKIARSFELPRAELFAAWTEPERIVEWMATAEIAVEILEGNFSSGGLFRFRLIDADGREAFGAWKFQEVIAGRRLIFTEHQNARDRRLLLRGESSAEVLETRVTFTGFHGVETFLDIESMPLWHDLRHDDAFEVRRDSLARGWDATLGRLEQHCTSGKIVHF